MATLGISGIAAALNVVLADVNADQFRRDSVLLNLLAIGPAAGPALYVPIKVAARTAGGAYDGGADMGAGDFDSHVRLNYSIPWAGYRAGVLVSDEAMDIAASTPNAFGGSILADEIRDAISIVSTKFAAHLYSGNSAAVTPELAGAVTAVDSADDNLFGIDTGVYPSWKSGEDTIALASLTLASISAKLIRPVIDAKGRKPDFITCPGNAFDVIKGLVNSMADTVTEIRVGARGFVDIYAAVGASAVTVDGVPVIEDRHCTANTMYAWTADDVAIRYVPVAPENVTPAQLAAAVSDITGAYLSENDIQARLRAIASNGRLTPVLAPLAKDGSSNKLMVRVPQAQVQWKTRNGFAKLHLT